MTKDKMGRVKANIVCTARALRELRDAAELFGFKRLSERIYHIMYGPIAQSIADIGADIPEGL